MLRDNRLPVRKGENVFVWLSRFTDAAQERAFTDRWSGASGWRDEAPADVLGERLTADQFGFP